MACLYAFSDDICDVIVSFVVSDDIVGRMKFIERLAQVDRRHRSHSVAMQRRLVLSGSMRLARDPIVRRYLEIKHVTEHEADVVVDVDECIMTNVIQLFGDNLACNRWHGTLPGEERDVPSSITVVLQSLRPGRAHDAFVTELRQMLTDACLFPNPLLVVKILRETIRFPAVIPPWLLVDLLKSSLPSNDPLSMACAYAIITDSRWKSGKPVYRRPIVPNVLLHSLFRRGHGLSVSREQYDVEERVMTGIGMQAQDVLDLYRAASDLGHAAHIYTFWRNFDRLIDAGGIARADLAPLYCLAAPARAPAVVPSTKAPAHALRLLPALLQVSVLVHAVLALVRIIVVVDVGLPALAWFALGDCCQVGLRVRLWHPPVRCQLVWVRFWVAQTLDLTWVVLCHTTVISSVTSAIARRVLGPLLVPETLIVVFDWFILVPVWVGTLNTPNTLTVG
ncbi:unnamed protein product (mitochondrion) [Plasmodiophora brassicae]|uniref:Uncharacterized protein n=1 Tax=Plasmodiophora brassicae TaxID=37360 RepID=A0A3P3YCV2_PLABS|nr:unnamed protein product [Plasmodiophora brassicae]